MIIFSHKISVMLDENPIKTLRVSRFLWLLAGFAFLLQLIVISYNHYTGYIHLKGTVDFITRLIYGSVFAFIAANILAWPNLKVVHLLNRHLPWHKKIIKRVLVELGAVIAVGTLVASFITILANSIDAYEEPFFNVLVNNVLITIVVNLIFMTILEAWLFFSHGKTEQKRAEELSKELELMKFEVLKDQLKPHFMFNSLNVLSGLIDENVEKAQEFIDEFSYVYRYVLETIEKNVISIREELEFAKSYMFLQQVRYGKALQFSVNVSAEKMENFIPPLSLQLVLENAIKHNEINEKEPLHVHVLSEANGLRIKNNLRPKAWAGHSSGIGQDNLQKRYRLVGAPVPVFTVKEKEYHVFLPWIEIE